jgi:hypothetical protein
MPSVENANCVAAVRIPTKSKGALPASAVVPVGAPRRPGLPERLAPGVASSRFWSGRRVRATAEIAETVTGGGAPCSCGPHFGALARRVAARSPKDVSTRFAARRGGRRLASSLAAAVRAIFQQDYAHRLKKPIPDTSHVFERIEYGRYRRF